MPGKMDARYNPAWLLAGKPTGFQTENLGPYQADANLSALTSGVMLSVALPLQAGDLITNLTFVSATTAAGTPTAYWFALYDDSSTPALLAQTADQTNTAWAANTAKTLALSSPQAIARSAVYYAAIIVAASTPPTLLGKSVLAAGAGSILSSKVMAQTSGSSLTTTAPSTIASPTTVANVAYVIAT